MSTSLYTPYKAVGIVTDGKPFAVNQLGTETFLTVTIGSVFQVYRTDKLTVSLVGRETPGAQDIAAIAVCDKETFCAAGNHILVYNRQQLVRTYDEHNKHDNTTILGLCMVGRILLSWDNHGEMRVIDTQKRVVISELCSLQHSRITIITHPATYINKFMVGYENGELELWNVKKCKIIHTFACHKAYFDDIKQEQDKISSNDIDMDFFSRNIFNEDNKNNTNKYPGVTCMEQSPAADVYGVGFSDGTILMVNLKLDRVLFSFKQDNGGNITSLSFRTDSTAKVYPFMASSSSDGRIYIWNLGAKSDQDDSDSDNDDDDDDSYKNKSPKLVRKLHTSLEEAHRGAISNVHFLHGEPILISAAADNTIKMWIFDAPDGSARLLRSREGHLGHPNKIRYYGGDTAVSMRDNATAESCEMISAGSDGTLRLFNTAIETQNRELSQKPILKKLGLSRRNERLPIVSDFAFSETRQRDWGNLVTIHHQHANSYLWRYKHRVVTEIVLRQPSWRGDERIGSSDRGHHSTAVAVTPCGNYALIGTRSGIIYKYNLQSGLPRGSFPANEANNAIKKGTLDTYARVPGNVRHDHNKLVGGPGWVPLNPNATNVSDVDTRNQHILEQLESSSQIMPECHEGEVKGIFVDTSNSIMVSCGLDGNTIFWDIMSGKVINCIHSDTSHLMMIGLRDAGFVAIASQDRIIRVYDLTTCKLARRFDGHTREISDLAFTPDGRRLLSASADSTIRVWDMPTGRCLTWLLFTAPVLSLAVALSGESLAISQAGKDGIYLYVDRSLYEPVMFWKEPTKPIPVADSSVISIDSNNTEYKEELGDVSSDDGDTDSADENALGNEDDDEKMIVKATQAQVENEGISKETIEQRAPGAITMSALPRGYWATLFHLEAIKARNKPIAPVEAPKSAPFFLPTVFRGGSTTSFPTPQEFAKLQTDLEQKEMAIGETTVFLTPGSKRNAADATNSNSSISKNNKKTSSSNKKQKTVTDLNDEDEDEEAVLAQLASMGSSWNDDDDDDDWGASSSSTADTTTIESRSRLTESHASDFRPLSLDGSHNKDENMDATFDNSSSTSRINGGSRLISRRTVLPRCKLVAFLLAEYPDSALGTYASAEYFQGSRANNTLNSSISSDGLVTASPTLEYLKTLAPPAVDVELRALCTHGEDEEGLKLLHCLLSWLAQRIISARDFEVLEAYLHRTLLIYGEIIVIKPSLLTLAQNISKAHTNSTSKLRSLVQGNLCLLKLLANLPPL